MNAIHEFQSRGKEYKVAGTAEGGRFRLLARSPTSGFFETVAYSDQESIQADMLAELARLATQKAENLPDGSREFVWHWPYKIQLDPPRLFLRDGDGWSPCDAVDRIVAPPLEILAEQFAALGREQGRAEAMRENVSLLPAAGAMLRKDQKRIEELEQTESESRADVADLSRRLDDQKARADKAEFAASEWQRVATRNAESWYIARADAVAAQRQLAILEGELVAAKTAAAGRSRTEGAPLAMCATFDPSIAGTYEPHARLYIQRGDSVFSLREGLDREGLEWIKLPPLPPIEPAKAGAEEREPAPPALARHDWHTHRGHVSCERCGAPFSEVRNDQACGAQP